MVSPKSPIRCHVLLSLPLTALLVCLPATEALPNPAGITGAERLSSPGLLQQEEQEELELIRRELDILSDSLEVSVDYIERGRDSIDYIRQELRRLEEDLESLGDVPGSLPLWTSLSDLRRRVVETSFRRALAGMPEAREMLEPEVWLEYAPQIERRKGISTRRDIFLVGEDVEIGLFEKVRGDVVVIGGKITVNGSVTGNVVSIFDDIHVTSTAHVEGDAVTIGGHIQLDPGGTISGNFVDTHGFWPSHWFWTGNRVALFGFSLAGLALLLAVTVMTGLIAPKNVNLVEHQVRTRFGTSFLVGLATEIFLPIVVILLIITIIGIPVALILLPITLIGLFLLGFTAVALAVGRGAGERGLNLGESPLALIAMGVLLLELVYLVGRVMGIATSVFIPISFATRLVGLTILFLAWTTGLGAALMTRFGTRTPGQKRDSEPKPAPPPVGAEVIT